MKIRLFVTIGVIIFLFFSLVNMHVAGDISKDNQNISGTIVKGYRILPIQKTSDKVLLTVYRGDYIKFKFDDKLILNPVVSIPKLSIKQKIPLDVSEAPYFKMKTAGTFSFSLGTVKGDIKVVEYRQPNYREVMSNEAAELIKNVHPIILDVRTFGEYKKGHLKNSVLIPVQNLQSRLKELSSYKNERILIYCATGNRSTVASKILIDNGFKRIFNMRYGIYDWRTKNYPIVH